MEQQTDRMEQQQQQQQQQQQLPPEIKLLFDQYMSPESSNHLELNANKILRNIRMDALLQPSSVDTINYFKHSLEYFSKMKALKILRGRKRLVKIY